MADNRQDTSLSIRTPYVRSRASSKAHSVPNPDLQAVLVPQAGAHLLQGDVIHHLLAQVHAVRAALL